MLKVLRQVPKAHSGSTTCRKCDRGKVKKFTTDRETAAAGLITNMVIDHPMLAAHQQQTPMSINPPPNVPLPILRVPTPPLGPPPRHPLLVVEVTPPARPLTFLTKVGPATIAMTAQQVQLGPFTVPLPEYVPPPVLPIISKNDVCEAGTFSA